MAVDLRAALELVARLAFDTRKDDTLGVHNVAGIQIVITETLNDLAREQGRELPYPEIEEQRNALRQLRADQSR